MAGRKKWKDTVRQTKAHNGLQCQWKKKKSNMSYLVCAFWKNASMNRKNYVQILITVRLEEITILQLSNKFPTRNRNSFVTARYLSLFLCMCVCGGGVRRLFHESLNNSDGGVDGSKMGE